MSGDDPVYPQDIPSERGRLPKHLGGLTKREHFAARAMQSMINRKDAGDTPTAYELCAAAVRYADELIVALNRRLPDAA